MEGIVRRWFLLGARGMEARNNNRLLLLRRAWVRKGRMRRAFRRSYEGFIYGVGNAIRSEGNWVVSLGKCNRESKI